MKDRNRMSVDEGQYPYPPGAVSARAAVPLPAARKKHRGQAFRSSGGTAISLLAKRLDPSTAHLQRIPIGTPKFCDFFKVLREF
jgi:hypothetical protein